MILIIYYVIYYHTYSSAKPYGTSGTVALPYHCTGEYEGEKAAGAGAEGRGELTGNSPLGRWSWGWRAKPQNHSRYCCVSGLTAGPGVRMYGTVDDPSLQY
jgi:hypothetical protein